MASYHKQHQHYHSNVLGHAVRLNDQECDWDKLDNSEHLMDTISVIQQLMGIGLPTDDDDDHHRDVANNNLNHGNNANDLNDDEETDEAKRSQEQEMENGDRNGNESRNGSEAKLTKVKYSEKFQSARSKMEKNKAMSSTEKKYDVNMSHMGVRDAFRRLAEEVAKQQELELERADAAEAAASTTVLLLSSSLAPPKSSPPPPKSSPPPPPSSSSSLSVAMQNSSNTMLGNHDGFKPFELDVESANPQSKELASPAKRREPSSTGNDGTNQSDNLFGSPISSRLVRNLALKHHDSASKSGSHRFTSNIGILSSGVATLESPAIGSIGLKKKSILDIEDRIEKRNPGASIVKEFQKILSSPTVDLDALKALAWHGIPIQFRAVVWKLLLGYLPASAARRQDALARKRRDYQQSVEQHFGSSHVYSQRLRNSTRSDGGGGSVSGKPPLNPQSASMSGVSKAATTTQLPGGSSFDISEYEEQMHRQISVDIPRTCPEQRLFRVEHVQAALERVLYVWAMRHPASGYVQGMNDLVTPFFFVFYTEQLADDSMSEEMLGWANVDRLSASALANAEADAYWCLTALLDSIHDYYIFAQPGIQKRVHYMKELVARVDPEVHSHLLAHGLDYIQFAFRWMNCLLMRELPFVLIVRMWDTYLSESDGFGSFHVYVCAALLCFFRAELMTKDFQDLVLFLQHVPTAEWTQKDLDMILSQAYMWRALFDSSVHLQRVPPASI